MAAKWQAVTFHTGLLQEAVQHRNGAFRVYLDDLLRCVATRPEAPGDRPAPVKETGSNASLLGSRQASHSHRSSFHDQTRLESAPASRQSSTHSLRPPAEGYHVSFVNDDDDDDDDEAGAGAGAGGGQRAGSAPASSRGGSGRSIPHLQRMASNASEGQPPSPLVTTAGPSSRTPAPAKSNPARGSRDRQADEAAEAADAGSEESTEENGNGGLDQSLMARLEAARKAREQEAEEHRRQLAIKSRAAIKENERMLAEERRRIEDEKRREREAEDARRDQCVAETQQRMQDIKFDFQFNASTASRA